MQASAALIRNGPLARPGAPSPACDAARVPAEAKAGPAAGRDPDGTRRDPDMAKEKPTHT